MKLTKNEESILEIENFIIDMKKILDIQSISVQLFSTNGTKMKFNIKKGLAPLNVSIIRHDGLKSEYLFQEVSDDEYPQRDKLDNHIDYYQMKNLIKEYLPITLSSKSIYENIDNTNYNYKFTDKTIENNDVLKCIKIKRDFIELENNIPNMKKQMEKQAKFKV